MIITNQKTLIKNDDNKNSSFLVNNKSQLTFLANK